MYVSFPWIMLFPSIGIGVSFWRFAAYVAVMEYFRRHRMTAIVLSGLGRVAGIYAGVGILARPLQYVWPDVRAV